MTGYCFVIDCATDAANVHKFIEYCCLQNLPHNVFFTFGIFNELRVFLFPRLIGKFNCDKVYTSVLNIAFCELAGYLPIGDEDLYATITENDVVKRFGEELGDVCTRIENDIVNLYK